MIDNLKTPGWPAYRLGLNLFQMVVNDKPTLIYAGLKETAIERYTRFIAARVVFVFQGDVLYSCQGDGDMYVCEATPDQVAEWTAAFLGAIANETADATDPAEFALLVSPAEVGGRDTA